MQKEWRKKKRVSQQAESGTEEGTGRKINKINNTGNIQRYMTLFGWDVKEKSC